MKVAGRLGTEGVEAAGKFGAAALSRGLSLRDKLAARADERALDSSAEHDAID